MTTFAVETVVMLLILYLAIGKWPWPALKVMMAKRQEEISKALESAESARNDAASAEGERQTALAEGRAQAAEIVAQARRNTEQVASESEARAQAEYDRIIAHAQAEVVLERQRAVEDAAAMLGDVVMAVVTEVIDREADARVHQDLINQAVGALNATTGSERTGIGR
jgi:F-type H+-transporting ATPase subunit b